MTRSAALTPLSRDHHHGLFAALELGRRLSAHIRQEKNVLFPLVEETLPPDELAALGEAIAAAER